ncbi:alpha/beta hydrolase [Spirosoma migulaei]
MDNQAQGGSDGIGPIKQIDAGVLTIGYVDVGPTHSQPVILLHGWPYSIYSFTDVAPLLVLKGYRVIMPHLRGHGTTRFLSEQTPRNGQQSALAQDIIALMDALGIQKAIVGGFDWGARTANIMAALWPERCTALVSVSGYLIGSQQANQTPLSPKAEMSWWYQFYFATERGRMGYEANRSEFARLIWQTASPQWPFTEATFAQAASVLANPDHVAIVIHNYRWRLGVADGEARYDALEKRLATAPTISVPTVTLEGDANGAPHQNSASYATKFSGPYIHHTLMGGIGHNLPQEAPTAFAESIVEANQLAR